MMMPANFSAVNAEIVYGGAVADYLPAKWTSKNFQTLSTNVLTILSNTFTKLLVNATLGTMFSGTWGDGSKLFGDEGSLTALYKVGRVPAGADQTFGNKIMTTLGLAASVYTLGTTGVKNYVGETKVITIDKNV